MSCFIIAAFLLPIFRIPLSDIREMIEVSPNYAQATNRVYNGWIAVLSAILRADTPPGFAFLTFSALQCIENAGRTFRPAFIDSSLIQIVFLHLHNQRTQSLQRIAVGLDRIAEVQFHTSGWVGY